ncbi:hypothetical protein [Microbulbifer thermotolerans]|uniref:FHA domain-containing protein n=1 Tax=Microbulbifer thermotolerans TaxID=252514 RepID=A0AB35HVM5_MICTH|nr:hypothetical protein [Microbulbifer thermotolerans]MCX2779456.1 hypothetical protein [Microbulbifer thermotolerans]MCX2801265.1 hypothetical protein [Microbulbifer thermotolerans]MCX2806099.1 hypothetical protein [Microbulbifer thermotolerans]
MTQGVLEINDCGLRVFSGTDEVLDSPGVAVIDNQQILVGTAALMRARSHPTQVNNQFWRRLSLESLKSDNARCRHHADLAYCHLQDIAEHCDLPQEVVLAVPGNFTREQLALLLGIVNESPVNAVGLVDAATACISAVAPRGVHLHVELQRHQTLVSRIAVHEQAELDIAEAIGDSGLQNFQDAWARVFTDAFIMQCRFDPLHSAEVEQQLYDLMPQWVSRAMRQGEVMAELDDRTAKVSLRQLQDACAPILSRVRAMTENLAEENSIVFVSHRWGEIPGGAQLTGRIHLLPHNCVALSVTKHWEEIYSEPPALRLVNALSAAPATEVAVQINTAAETAATHLLFGHRALAARQPLFVYSKGNKLNITPTPPDHPAATVTNHAGRLALRVDAGTRLMLNGEEIAAPVNLSAGDRIGVPDHDEVITAISVEHYGA